MKSLFSFEKTTTKFVSKLLEILVSKLEKQSSKKQIGHFVKPYHNHIICSYWYLYILTYIFLFYFIYFYIYKVWNQLLYVQKCGHFSLCRKPSTLFHLRVCKGVMKKLVFVFARVICKECLCRRCKVGTRLWNLIVYVVGHLWWLVGASVKFTRIGSNLRENYNSIVNPNERTM